MTYLDRSNVGVLGSVFVLIEPVLGEFTLLEVDAKLDKQEHDRLQ